MEYRVWVIVCDCWYEASHANKTVQKLMHGTSQNNQKLYRLNDIHQVQFVLNDYYPIAIIEQSINTWGLVLFIIAKMISSGKSSSWTISSMQKNQKSWYRKVVTYSYLMNSSLLIECPRLRLERTYIYINMWRVLLDGHSLNGEQSVMINYFNKGCFMKRNM
jgi:cephalosporin hydroxylase